MIASLRARSVDPLPRLDGHIEMARRIRHPSQEREVGSGEWGRRVHSNEQLVCVLPIAACRGVARLFERRRVGGLLHAHPLRRARRPHGAPGAVTVTREVPTVTPFVTHL